MNRYKFSKTLKTTSLHLLSICLLVLLYATDVYCQQIQVTGKITDAKNNPVAGAKVYIGEFSSSFSNDSGVFTLNVPSYSATLQVEADGFSYIEKPLKGNSNIDIKLYESGFISLYENIGLPLSSGPKSNTTVAAGVINMPDIIKTSVESPESFIQGKVAGVNTTFRSGMPGSGASIYIRGYNSLLLNNQPLVVIDGMLAENYEFGETQIKNSSQSLLSYLDIRDIQSISFIKDATSLYGSKASNGVILITTMHNADPTTKITFQAYGGTNMMPDLYPVIDANNYKTFLSEIMQSQGYSAAELAAMPTFNDNMTSGYYKYHNNTNWQKEVFNNSFTQNYYLKVNGGDNIAKYNISIGYGDQGGIVKNTDFSRFNSKFNFDILFSKKLTVNANLGFSSISRSLFDDGISRKTNPVYLSLVKAPFLAPYRVNETGESSSEIEDYENFSNPIALFNNSKFKNNNTALLGSIHVNYKITDWLTFKSLVGLNNNKIRENVFVPALGVVPDTTINVLMRAAKIRTNQITSFYNQSNFNLTKSINSIHNLSANIGLRLQLNKLKDSWSRDYNSANDFSQSLGLGDPLLAQKGGFVNKYNWISYFGSFEYNLNKKYFVSTVLEIDGSSRFSKTIDLNGLSATYKFATFPSIGAAWLVSSENFMKNIPFIDLLKLRVSYGITGNGDLGNNWNELYYNSTSYFSQSVIVRGNLLNPDLQWENVKKTNAGIDLSLFNQRVSASIEMYKHITDNMITLVSAPSVSGFNTYFENSGSMENSGFELGINTRILNGKVKWDIGLTYAKNKNKVTKLPEGEIVNNIAGANILTKVGNPVGVFYGYRTLGVFASDQEASQSGLYTLVNGSPTSFKGGDIHFVNLNSDSLINSDDMDVIGDPNPDFTGGISNTISWNGITLDALITFTSGNDVYNYQRAILESMSGYENQTLAVMNRWRADGQVTEMPKAAYGDPMGNSRFSDRWIEDGSFIRLKTISVSYNLPIKSGFFKSAVVYATGNNLITLTKYKGYDPEFSMGTNPLVQGIDFGYIPQYKSVIFGIKLGL